MEFVTDYKVEYYILHTRWEEFPAEVINRARVCAVDLMAALTIGSRGRQFNAGLSLAGLVNGGGDIPIVGSKKTFGFLGAVTAMGHAANAFDIDDGHNMIKGHPGASFIAGALAAALEKNITYKAFLTGLVVSYELTIRCGLAIQRHYNYYHSSGSYGAFGTAAAVGRIYGFTREQLNTVLSIAEYHAPMTPVMHAVRYPSMNKDGISLGSIIGALAVLETLAGVSGRGYLLEAPEFKPLAETLGSRHEIMNLYFKPYTCCRWAHQPIRACIELMNEHGFGHGQIERVKIYTFAAAANLSSSVPKSTDEAQYNILYPVACALVYRDVGFLQVIEDNLNDRHVLDLMDRIEFVIDPELDGQFPQKRYARVEITLDCGQTLCSRAVEADGEASDGVDFDWIANKFKRITRFMYDDKSQDAILNVLNGPLDISMREIITMINKCMF